MIVRRIVALNEQSNFKLWNRIARYMYWVMEAIVSALHFSINVLITVCRVHESSPPHLPLLLKYCY
jgi:hypothetical protein